jgi:arylsulfatase
MGQGGLDQPARVGTRRRGAGSDIRSPVSDDYSAEGNVFNGIVEGVQIDIDDAAEDNDHLITPEERLRIAMARQ